MFLAEILIARVGNESKLQSTLKRNYRNVSIWYASTKRIDVIIRKVISWYGRGARGRKSISPPWLSYCRLVFLQISVL